MNSRNKIFIKINEREIEMIKLEILNINNYEYKLKDEKGNYYNLNLDFLDINKKPEIGDYMYVKEKFLDPNYEGYSTSYTFGSLENEYGKENIVLDDIDVIKIEIDKLEIYLKRLYG